MSECTCGSIGNTDGLRLCPKCHRYWRNDKELTSVTRVIKSTWPIPPDFSQADPAVLENARDRGVELDTLFSAYIDGKLEAIPAGTRTDVVELFDKLYTWWNRQGLKAKSQVILADDEIAGTCDIMAGESIFDLKCTYNIEVTYPFQLGMYALLNGADRLGIIHVTARFKEPKLINVPVEDAMRDARTVREMWKLVKRSTK